MKDLLLNNQITLTGELSALTFDHEAHDEEFYSGTLKAKRLSDTYDEIPVIISNKIWDVKKYVGKTRVSIKGQIRTFNKHDGEKNRLIISVFVRGISETSLPEDNNELYIEGYICKKPLSRTTPSGRKIADILVAVNRPYGKSDYIPCICWGRNAKFVDLYNIGTKIILHGRLQSRVYDKKLEDGGYIKKTAYEVSAHKMKLGA